MWNILQHPRFWNSSSMSSKHISRSVVASCSFLNIDHTTVIFIFRLIWGSPGSSADEESACNARDPGLIPGSGRYPGEGIGYPHQYSWASLVVQMVKNLPAMRETWAQCLDWEYPLEKGTATHFSILAWRIPWTEEHGRLHTAHEVAKRVRHDWVTKHTQT